MYSVGGGDCTRKIEKQNVKKEKEETTQHMIDKIR
tara:strand:+ start:435 stop:539 length:105 start_codon:yes stop_codon:yes gene_type:complete